MNDLTKDAIKKLIGKNDPIILEVGSYNGEDSLEMLREMPQAEIYAFEADPTSIQHFKDLNHPDEIVLVEKAVGKEDGYIDWYPSQTNHGKRWSLSSSLKKPLNHLRNYPTVSFKAAPDKVECVKLDSWSQENIGESIIDFIWCDVNGAEEEMILGAIETLQNKTKYFYTECFDTELWEGQVNTEWILETLDNFEFLGKYGHNILLKNKTLE
jgi:FkbM family methyltransferase